MSERQSLTNQPRGNKVTEIDLNVDQAREFIQNNDAYGSDRLYGILADTEECAGQIVGIKSNYYLDRSNYSRIYVVSHDPNNILNIQRA